MTRPRTAGPGTDDPVNPGIFDEPVAAADAEPCAEAPGGRGSAGAGDLSAWMSRQGERVERALDAALPAVAEAVDGLGAGGLVEAMRYAVLGGGKRVRP